MESCVGEVFIWFQPVIPALNFEGSFLNDSKNLGVKSWERIVLSLIVGLLEKLKPVEIVKLIIGFRG